MKKLILGTDTFYASTDGATADGAGTPDQLVAGSVGIYAISASTNKPILLNSDGNSAGTTASTTVTDEFIVAVGTATGGPLVSQPIKLDSFATGFPKKVIASADVLHMVAVGYNGTSGSLNTPTIADRDFANVKLSLSTNGITQKIDKDNFEASNLRAGDTDYDVASGILAAVDARDAAVKFVGAGDIVSNGSGTAFDTSGTATVTNGSTTVTTSAAHGVTAGNYVGLADVASGQLYTYLTVAGTTGSTIVLDRPWRGSTQVIANAGTLDMTTPPTEFGVFLIADEPGITFEASVGGVFEDADLTYGGYVAGSLDATVAGAIGHGSALWMAEQVRLHGSFTGYYDQIDRRRPAPDFNLTPGATYTVFYLNVNPSYKAKDEMNANFTTEYNVQVGFDDTATNDNLSEFELTLEALTGLTL